MSKKRKNDKPDFDSYYADLFPDRWERLKQSFLQEKAYAAYTAGLLTPYYLDKASVLAARELGVKPGDAVLDMCAAPGGKTLVLASSLDPAVHKAANNGNIENGPPSGNTPSGRLIANERSAGRRARLRRVLHEHLPEALLELVTVTGHDAGRWGLYEQDAYDRILVDVPCSSERHIALSAKHRSVWSPARTKHLAVQALAMLLAAVAAAGPGGKIVYSTCALSPTENDGVIEKALKKRKNILSLLPLSVEIGEHTSFGVQIWPDVSDGMGPIYYCSLLKNPDR